MRSKRVVESSEEDDAVQKFIDELSDSDSSSTPYRLSPSIVSKGRPAMKRSQKATLKKKRMKRSNDTATRLVLGTLVPVQDPKAVRATIDEAFTVVSAMPVLGSLTQVDAPPLRATKIVLLSKAKPNPLRVTEVYPCEFAMTCLKRIHAVRDIQEQNRFGVRITGVGAFIEEDVTTMRDWHKAHSILEDMANLIMWVRSSKYDRINLPTTAQKPLSTTSQPNLKIWT
jgi:hypothetical protein